MMPSRKKVKADDAMLFAQIRSIPTVNGYSSFFLDGWAGTQRQLSPAADMSRYTLWAAMGQTKNEPATAGARCARSGGLGKTEEQLKR
jgi:hypothetical protein